MFVYEKSVMVNNSQERHLFGTMGSIPSNNDSQLTYRDSNGSTLTPNLNATYVDDGRGGILIRPNNTVMTVFIGNNNIIPGPGIYEVKPVAIAADTTGMKTAYNVNETFDTNGLVVTASYSDGTNAATNEFTTTPANNTVFMNGGNVTVNVAGVNAFNGLTTSFNVAVTAEESWK